jgi:hypothetical protein
MKTNGQLLPGHATIHRVEPADTSGACTITRVESAGPSGVTQVVLTRDHDAIRRWAEDRRAEPATGEATRSGPATVTVNDGGAGIRFNFPGHGAFRPITWDEWFANFDQHGCAFVYDDDGSTPLSNRYRIVKADDWRDFLC